MDIGVVGTPRQSVARDYLISPRHVFSFRASWFQHMLTALPATEDMIGRLHNIHQGVQRRGKSQGNSSAG